MERPASCTVLSEGDKLEFQQGTVAAQSAQQVGSGEEGTGALKHGKRAARLPTRETVSPLRNELAEPGEQDLVQGSR